MSVTMGGAGKATVKLDVIRADASTQREQFCALLWNGPMEPTDAVIVLCGEDAAPRITAAAAFVRTVSPGGHILLSGGRHDPPRWIGAHQAKGMMMGEGMSPSAIITDELSQNTREQAVECSRIIANMDWHSVTLTASPYHTPRAFLTFLKALHERGLDRKVRMLCLPDRHVPWSHAPAGMDRTRMQLLDDEFIKIGRYREHVASFVEGIEYLCSWEVDDDAP